VLTLSQTSNLLFKYQGGNILINRRNLLRASISTVAISMLPSTPILASVVTQNPTKHKPFQYLIFKDLQGTKFSISTGLLGQIDTQLSEVINTTSHPQVEQFVINFTSSNPTSKLTEGLYDVYHQNLGWFQLHLKPIEKQDKNECYQATFCLLT